MIAVPTLRVSVTEAIPDIFNEERVPTDVIFGCAAVVIIPENVVAVTAPPIDKAVPTILLTSISGEPVKPLAEVAIPLKVPENVVAVTIPLKNASPSFLKMIVFSAGFPIKTSSLNFEL